MNGATSNDPVAESSLVAALLRDARRVVELARVDFAGMFDPRHRLIANACLMLVAEGKPVDQVTVADKLAASKALEAAGGYSYLADLCSLHLTVDNVAHYARIVADHDLKRRVCLAASRVLEIAGHEVNSGEDVLGAFLGAANSTEGMPNEAEADDLRAIVKDAAGQMAEMASGRGVHRGVKTGYTDLDGLTGGLALGAVTILAGRPSQGKSAFARRVAYNAAEHGMPAHVFSLEDTKHRYGERTLSDLAGVDLSKFSDPSAVVTKGDLERMQVAINRTTDVPLLIDDAAALSSVQIANRVRARKRAHGTKLVVVDYVQLIRERGSRDKRDEVDRAGEAMVKLARDENVAVLLLSQLSRESEKRDDPRPVLSDLRESGTLEQIADAVFMVCQPWRYLNPEKNAAERAAYEKALNVGEVIVRKNKHGRQGTVKLQWDAPTATYRDLAQDWQSSYGVRS